MLDNFLQLLSSSVKHQRRVFFVAGVLLLGFWLLLQQNLRHGAARTLNEQESSNMLLVHALEDSVTRAFQSVNSSMHALAESLPQIAPEEVPELLKTQLRTSPQLRSFELIQADSGEVVASANANAIGKLDYACIAQIRNEPLSEFIIGKPKPGRYPNDRFATRSGLAHIPVCLPVQDAQGQVRQILIASANPQYFDNLFRSISETLTAAVQVYRYDGALLLGERTLKAPIQALMTQVLQRGWGSFRYSIDEQNYLISYRSTSLLPLITVMAASEQAALSSWYQDKRLMQLVFAVVSALILLMALVVALLLEKKRQDQGDIHLLSTAIRSTANAIFITNRDGEIHWVNRAFSQLTGYSFDEVRGKNPKILNAGVHSPAFFADLWQMILSGESWRGELVNRHKDGRRMTVEQTVTPIFDPQGKPEHFIAVHEDVTARKNAEQKALFLADHDPLTSLPNRRYFEQQLQKMDLEHKLDQVSIFFIDLDRFKEINDTLGHEAGDALLIHAASQLRQTLPAMCLIVRLGGDEFAVLSDQGDSEAVTAQLAEKILHALAQPFCYAEGSYSITCSVGIAMGRCSARNASMMLRQADLAMYRAKHDGRNTYRFFDDKMDREMSRRVHLQQQLDLSLSRGGEGLSLYFQPQVCGDSGELYGAEALLRWCLPDGEQVSPAEFIPLAEDTGQILELGSWLTENLFRTLARWNREQLYFGVLSVNISALQLARDNLAEQMQTLQSRFSVPGHQVCIEITETTLMVDSAPVADNLKQLKQAGFVLSIDDFGTGYSSMSYLRALQANHLKIDRSFIIGIGKYDSDEHIVRATIALAHSLGMETVAEGVDSPEQLAFLQQLGCDYIQGYLFARPLPAPDFERYVKASRVTEKEEPGYA